MGKFGGKKPVKEEVEVADVVPPPSYLSQYGAKAVDIREETHLGDGFVLNLFGQTDTGKDSFCVTAPMPALMVETEPNGLLRARKHLDTRQIYRIDASKPPDSGVGHEKLDALWQEGCQKVLKNLTDAYDRVMQDKKIPTVILNTETDLWDLARAAQFGRLFQVMQLQFAHVNPVMEAFYTKARKYKKNLIVVQRAEYGWETVRDAAGRPVLDKMGKETRTQTEELEGKGWKNTPFLSDIILGLDKTKTKKLGVKNAPKRVYSATVLKCGFGDGVEDRVFEGDEVTWDHLMSAIRGEV